MKDGVNPLKNQKIPLNPQNTAFSIFLSIFAHTFCN